MFLFFRIERRNQDDNFQQHSSNQHNTEAIGCEPHPDGCRPNHLSSPSFLTLLISLSLVAGTAWCRWRGSNPHEFQSISLMRGETRHSVLTGRCSSFQFTPLMREETPEATAMCGFKRFQSTPLMRGETAQTDEERAAVDISIHSPHARGDLLIAHPPCTYISFQSTPLMRGETRCI